MCVYVQESREADDGTAYYASNIISELSANFAGIKVLGKEQRKIINEGISEMNDLDDALMLGLNVETETRPDLGKFGRVLCITPQKVHEEVGIKTLSVEETSDLERGERAIQEYDPGIIVSSLGRNHKFEKEAVRRYFIRLNDFASKGNTLIHLVRQYPSDPLWTHWDESKAAEGLEWYHTSADLSFVCNDKEIAQIIIEWADGHDMYVPPMSIDDVGQEGFGKLLIELRMHRAEASAWTAYPAEMQHSVDEEQPEGPHEQKEDFDGIESDKDIGIESQTR